MSLPLEYETPKQYFHAALEFLKEFSWIYSTSNTQFLKENVLNNFPSDWIEYFENINTEDLNNFPDNLQKNNLPSSLKEFQNRLQKLKPSISLDLFNGTEIYLKRMSPKKLHEISRLSNLITEKCKDNINIVIDFGSGLGYLSEILYKHNKFKILGLECDANHVKSAKNRQNELYPLSKDQVFYKEEKITLNSECFIKTEIHQISTKTDEPKVAIIGLHSCADLSITSIQLFFKINEIKKLIIMPCCYHKFLLNQNVNSKRIFKNFPFSQTLTDIVGSLDGYNLLNRPFLRLACQQTVSRWRLMTIKQYEHHGNEMFIRGILECLINDNEIIQKVNTKNQSDILSFDNVFSKYNIITRIDKTVIDWNDEHKNRFNEIFNKYRNGNRLAEALTCLQTALQEFCENLFLLDKICFMEEHAKANDININLIFRKIMDDKLSPRCFVLIAEKL